MIFADKLMELRKKNGWSQEELAEKLEVSRQTISKWEGAQSVPDLGRMLKLSELLGVTTDFLIKDELELPAVPESSVPVDRDDTAPLRVSMEQAVDFLRYRERSGVSVALGVLLCILCPVTLILLGAARETGALAMAEEVAGGLGLMVLILLVAAGVALFLLEGFRGKPWEGWDQLPLDTAYGVDGMVRDRMEKENGGHVCLMVVGILLCVLCPLPLFCGMIFGAGDLQMAWAVAALLTMVALGVFCMVRTSVLWDGFHILLETGEFTRDRKLENRKNRAITAIYWGLATALYLACSFLTNRWDRSWIIWPVAGVFYGVLITVLRVIRKKA